MNLGNFDMTMNPARFRLTSGKGTPRYLPFSKSPSSNEYDYAVRIVRTDSYRPGGDVR